MLCVLRPFQVLGIFLEKKINTSGSMNVYLLRKNGNSTEKITLRLIC